MLVIPDDQVAVVQETRRSAFDRRLRDGVLAAMARVSPEVPEDEVARRYEAALARADGRGMRTERQLTRYAYSLVAFPPDFEEIRDYAWVSAILDGPGAADDRLDRLSGAMRR